MIQLRKQNDVFHVRGLFCMDMFKYTFTHKHNVETNVGIAHCSGQQPENLNKFQTRNIRQHHMMEQFNLG